MQARDDRLRKASVLGLELLELIAKKVNALNSG